MNCEFGLIEATSAHSRMEALCRFLEFWAGSRKPEFGELIDEINKTKLPTPLRRLYEFAGRWPSFKFGDSEIFLVPFVGNDRLRRVQFVEYGANQRIKFMAESQGAWDGCTLDEGEDPPVWKRTFHQRMRNDKVILRDKLVSRSLSSFLVTLVLRELVFGSRVHGMSEKLTAHFVSDRANAKPIWLEGVYMWEKRNSFFFWEKMLVLEELDKERPTQVFAANTLDESRFFWANCGPLREVIIQDFGIHEDDANLLLVIHGDGSATASSFSPPYGKTGCERGVFGSATFANLLHSAYFATYQLGEHNGDPTIRFHTEESYVSTEGWFLPRKLAAGLIEAVFAKSEDRNHPLRKLFIDRWAS